MNSELTLQKSELAMQRMARLEAAAAAWLGTPFCEFSALKAKGVCCHALPLEIYFEAAWLPRFKYPMTAPRAGGANKVEAFAVGPAAEFFARVDNVLPASCRQAQAGDTLHFRLGRTSHFVLQLGTNYIHAVHGSGVLYATHLPPAWLKRLHAVWRPTCCRHLAGSPSVP